MHDAIDELLTREVDTPAIADAEAWWRIHVEHTRGTPDSVAEALLGGFAADRLGYAFASGYTAALRRLLDDRGPARRRALCATESGGGHPRAIATTLQLQLDAGGGGRLTGDKTYVTLGHLAEELLVVATTGEGPDGRPRLRVVQVPAAREGVTIEPAPPTPFVPEIPHARLKLREVAIAADELLPGDGYLGVLKPFRTIEDAHVFLALLGWLTRLGRRAGFADELVEAGLVRIAGFAAVAASPRPLSPSVHRLLGGAIAAAREHVDALERADAWARLDAETRARWDRDRPLLDIAGKARARRLEVAREAGVG